MSVQEAHEVVIVGGGPVGLLLAIRLLRSDIDVVVLEAREERSTSSRAIGIHPPAIEAFQSVGVADQLLAEGVKVTGGMVVCQGRTLGSLDFGRMNSQHPFVLTLPQYRTETILERRLLARGSETLRRGARVTRVAHAHQSVGIEFLEHGERRHMTAQVVVAADGARSTVRNSMGITARSKHFADHYLMGDFTDSTAYGDLAVIHFEPDGVVESFPLPGGQRRWVAHTGGQHDDVSRDALVRLIRSRTGREIDAESNTMLSDFGVTRVLADRMAVGRVALIGDAGHAFSPIGGQGMNLGWLDAVALTSVLLRILRESGDAIALFARYEVERRSIARHAARQAESFMALGRPVEGTRMHLRNGVVRGAAHPLFRRRVARAFTMQAVAEL